MRTSPCLRARRSLYSLAAIVLAALAMTAASGLSIPAAAILAQTTPDCTQQPPVVEPATPDGYAVINFSNTCDQPIPLVVDVATNEAEWETGLMGVTDLPEDQGELFDFAAADAGHEIQIGFWMEGTPANLSVAFVGSNGVVEEIDDMQAETTDVHMPAQPYLYAIEANQGWFANNDIQPGSQADLSAALVLGSAIPKP